MVTKTNSDTHDIKTLKSYKEAISSPEVKLWKDAMDYELSKLSEMNTWEKMDKTDIPSTTQVLMGMWVHLVKKQEMGDLKFQSRWVVWGDKQKKNLSLSDTFMPVSCISSLQLLLALATLKDLCIFMWDVDLDYLHGKMNHESYISLPDGYDKPGKVL